MPVGFGSAFLPTGGTPHHCFFLVFFFSFFPDCRNEVSSTFEETPPGLVPLFFFLLTGVFSRV